MLLESLILFTCSAGSPGCSEARTAYVEQNPEVKTIIQRIGKKAENLGRVISADKYAPIIAAAYNKEVTIPVDKNFTIVLSDKEVKTKVVYAFEY